ncbi:EAL domain-containing protein [uncultured Hoeflea sp.]|uniref:EAL domain-containing protein n=1 Tax=uncultured Hoeflea sp. TaxID=538666 RepID=UPI0030DAE87F
MIAQTDIHIVIENLSSISAAYSEGVAGRVLQEVWRRFDAALGSKTWHCEEEAWGVSLRLIGDAPGDHLLEEVEAAVHTVSLHPIAVDSVRLVVALGYWDEEKFGEQTGTKDLDVARYRLDMSAAAFAYNALAAGEIPFAEQPIVAASDRERVLYCECLIRLPDGGGGAIMPGSFMPSIERLGLTRALDRCVVREALMQLRCRPQAVLGCNISGLSACNDLWWRSTINELRQTPDLAQRLVIEMTETALPPDPSDALDCLAAFKASGCRVALDDFGAGMSSITFARSLRPDIIKIDGLYVRDAVALASAEELLASLVAMTSCLADQVVVEGIEDERAVAATLSAGGRWLQGYFVGRPGISAEARLPDSPAARQPAVLAASARRRACFGNRRRDSL